MGTCFISLAVSATMFPLAGTIEMEDLTPSQVQDILDNETNIVSALNPSHASTIGVIRHRYGIEFPIPEVAPKVLLQSGDSVVILQAQLPRLAAGEKHSDEVIQEAPISFRRWTVR